MFRVGLEVTLDIGSGLRLGLGNTSRLIEPNVSANKPGVA